MAIVMNPGSGPLASLLTWIKQDLDLLIISRLTNVSDVFPSTSAVTSTLLERAHIKYHEQ